MNLLFTGLLVAAVFVSAVCTVTGQHEARHLFVEIQNQEKRRDSLNEEWGRLQLEQSTWSTDDRIESIARTKLQMHEPDAGATVLVRN